MELKTELTDEVCEHLFDIAIAPQLLQMQKKEIPYELEFMMEPAFYLNHEDIEIDVVPFLAYAIVKMRDADKCLRSI